MGLLDKIRKSPSLESVEIEKTATKIWEVDPFEYLEIRLQIYEVIFKGLHIQPNSNFVVVGSSTGVDLLALNKLFPDITFTALDPIVSPNKTLSKKLGNSLNFYKLSLVEYLKNKGKINSSVALFPNVPTHGLDNPQVLEDFYNALQSNALVIFYGDYIPGPDNDENIQKHNNNIEKYFNIHTPRTLINSFNFYEIWQKNK